DAGIQADRWQWPGRSGRSDFRRGPGPDRHRPRPGDRPDRALRLQLLLPPPGLRPGRDGAPGHAPPRSRPDRSGGSSRGEGGRMKLRKSRSARKGRIEIIPMIDVMFFLLATFMLASLTMLNLHSLGVHLPKGKAGKMH